MSNGVKKMSESKENSVLILEDLATDSKYLKNLIEVNLHAKCIIAKDLSKIQRKIKTNKTIGCIVTDLRLENDIAFGKRILFDQPIHNIPIIVVSAYLDETSIPIVNELAPLHIIAKPETFEPETSIQERLLELFDDQILQAVRGASYIRTLTRKKEKAKLETNQQYKSLQADIFETKSQSLISFLSNFFKGSMNFNRKTKGITQKDGKFSILIVEDIQHNFAYLRNIIESTLFSECFHADNMGYARSLLNDKSKPQFDCVLLKMTEEHHISNGYRILTEHQSLNIPFIILAGSIGENIIEKANELVPLFVIKKPHSYNSRTPIEEVFLEIFSSQILLAIKCAMSIRRLTKDKERIQQD